MDRREMLTALGGMAAIAATSGIAAAAEKGHEHHQMATPANAALAASSFDCVQTAETGIRHCLEELGKGDKSLAECASKMEELKIACTALGAFSSFGSANTKEMAKLTIKVCEESEKECRKFEKHKVCMDCAESCKKCIAECRKITA